MQWSQIFIKDGLNEGEGLELDELNYSGSSRKQQLPQLQPQCALGDTPATSHQLLMSAKANASPTSTPPTPPEEGHRMEKNGDPVKEAQGNPAPVVALRNGKTQTSLKTMSKRKISQHKEKKATQMLAIVLGKSAPLSLLCLKKPRFVAIINYRLNMQMRQFQIAGRAVFNPLKYINLYYLFLFWLTTSCLFQQPSWVLFNLHVFFAFNYFVPEESLETRQSVMQQKAIITTHRLHFSSVFRSASVVCPERATTTFNAKKNSLQLNLKFYW